MPSGHPVVVRKKYFIKKEFQARFIMKFLLIILAGIIISTCILMALSQNTLTSSYHDSRLIIKNTSWAILPAVLYTNLITLGLIVIAAIIVTLFISHKIAGPIFRFEKELENIGHGDLTVKVSLRKKDQVTEIADRINTMTGQLHQKVMGIKIQLDRIKSIAGKTDCSENLVQEINSLQENIEHNFKL